MTVALMMLPTPQSEDLARRVAGALLEESGDVMAELDAAMDNEVGTLREESALRAEAAACAEAVWVHWARSMLQDPGRRVRPVVSQQVLGFAREMFRRGIEQRLSGAHHAAQRIVVVRWMRLAFALSSDIAVLQQAIEIGTWSASAYVDDMLASVADELDRERAKLAGSTYAERFETVSLILEGAPISADRASARLGYDLGGRHVAAVLWANPASADQSVLVQAAEALARACRARQFLTVIASSSSVWLWYAAADASALGAELAGTPQVRGAIGSAEGGIEGFRRTHIHAMATQRLMYRLPDLRVARFDDVQLVTLATQDEHRARAFVARTLGDLAAAEPELRETVRTYIRQEFSASRAARALYTHRNTVINRLHRAERLLPIPLTGNGLRVGMALEIAHWFGPQPRLSLGGDPPGSLHQSERTLPPIID